jgi:alkylhydroperoxidase family enzyme
MSHLLECPAWAPPDSAAFRHAGLTTADCAALGQGQLAGLSAREQAALAYTREVVADSDVPDAVFARVAAALSEPEIVALGFAVAVQNGAIRVFRSMQEAGVQHDADHR